MRKKDWFGQCIKLYVLEILDADRNDLRLYLFLLLLFMTSSWLLLRNEKPKLLCFISNNL